ncbi:hypothetical protein J1605_017402 [Eschrichtius robustus]|uniref:Uncharacterized protein n=1 Tax=Eschrichtius robustus TaxID=9764 RepID=A0AB34I0S5_ESCRO|nr:hypothetical protein J1605_017402 [Eschrichtius robustus]
MLSLRPRDLVLPENDAFPAKGQTKTAPLCFVSAAQEPGPALPLSTSGRTGQGFKQGVATHQVGEDTPRPCREPVEPGGEPLRAEVPHGSLLISSPIAQGSVSLGHLPSCRRTGGAAKVNRTEEASAYSQAPAAPGAGHQAARWSTWAFWHHVATLQKEPKSRKEFTKVKKTDSYSSPTPPRKSLASAASLQQLDLQLELPNQQGEPILHSPVVLTQGPKTKERHLLLFRGRLVIAKQR